MLCFAPRMRVQPRNRMRENCTSGTARGVPGNRHSYRRGKVVAAYDAGAGATSGTDALARIHNEVLPDLAIYRSQLLTLFPEVGAPSALAHLSADGDTPTA